MIYESTLSMEKRKALGVWYTPIEVVEYMVKGVEAILLSHFQLTLSSAQILDPCTGTGTFLDAILKRQGTGEIHAVEIDTEAYKIACERFQQYKSLSLYNLNTLNSTFKIHNNGKVRVVIGNPPYNRKSKNQGKHIDDLLIPYAQKGSSGALADDYIKFTRFAEKMIDENGSGIVAYISNNSFLSSIAMTNMRKSLLKSFDEIYVLDFTGDPKDNIFKIKQTVCITFFVKTSNSQSYAPVFYKKVEGSREDKHNYCKVTSFQKTDFTKLNLLEPEYYFYPLDIGVKEEYTKDSFALDECFHVKGSGIKTNCDALVLDTRLQRLDTKIDAYFTKGDRAGASKGVDERKIKHSVTKKDGVFTKLPYRPFDTKAYFDSKLTEGRREEIRKHEKAENQVFLSVARVRDNNDFSHVLMSTKVQDLNFFGGKISGYSYPLYQYTEATEYSLAIQTTNFTDALIETLKSKTKLKFEDNSELSNPQTFSSLDIMNYIYGWLHDTSYRAKYNDFLKSNYPRVPYPKNEEQFRAYMQKGRAFSEVHLSEGIGWEDEVKLQGKGSLKIEGYGFDGSNLKLNSMVSTPLTQQEWDFKIGACKVIGSWLNYRTGDDLNMEEVVEFKRMVARVRRHLCLV